jgi:hypothetical protein
MTVSIYDKWIGRHVVVRSESAGVHIGTLTAVEGTSVELADARRLWRWEGAFSLSEVARRGIAPKGSRMAMAVPEHLVIGVIELIPTTDTARATFDATHE